MNKLENLKPGLYAWSSENSIKCVYLFPKYTSVLMGQTYTVYPYFDFENNLIKRVNTETGGYMLGNIFPIESPSLAKDALYIMSLHVKAFLEEQQHQMFNIDVIQSELNKFSDK